jgi:hypothetical protein
MSKISKRIVYIERYFGRKSLHYVNTLASMMKRLKYRASCRQCQCEKDVSP